MTKVAQIMLSVTVKNLDQVNILHGQQYQINLQLRDSEK